MVLDGLTVTPPGGWEVRLRRLEQGDDGQTLPVLHAATVPLPSDRGDYGGGVVETLGARDVFLSLAEFASEDANSALFRTVDEFPRSIDERDFHPRQLQRVIAGQAGQQVFFTFEDRPFCLYVVIGSAALSSELARKAEELLDSVSVEAIGRESSVVLDHKRLTIE